MARDLDQLLNSVNLKALSRYRCDVKITSGRDVRAALPWFTGTAASSSRSPSECLSSPQALSVLKRRQCLSPLRFADPLSCRSVCFFCGFISFGFHPAEEHSSAAHRVALVLYPGAEFSRLEAKDFGGNDF
ncbi:hypothetical protein EVAR_63431_1 [Eumeta japonica]|uniref:Uncharacterized protein n=1 Tax=Eumeta variegata TaxID=151549 RepID=A0A4C1YR79_EUMVA|nr:hypothetical protein EVAR_63431_1 [Eumeta japonica]